MKYLFIQFIVTTDVQASTVTIKPDSTVVQCSFIPGSQSKGCRVQFTETDDLSYGIETYDIERVSGTDSAEGEFTIILEDILVHNISVFDIEGDGSVGNVSVDVDIKESTVNNITTFVLRPGKTITIDTGIV